MLGTLSRAHSSAIYRIISFAFALEVIVQELLVQIKGTKQGVYHYEFKGGFRRRALLALYSTRINCNLDRPKRD